MECRRLRSSWTTGGWFNDVFWTVSGSYNDFLSGENFVAIFDKAFEKRLSVGLKKRNFLKTKTPGNRYLFIKILSFSV